MKKLWFPLTVLSLFLLCILRPAQAVAGAAAGLSLWYCTVLPTLLPCMVLSGYLISSSLICRLPSGPLALVTGWFCGYPMGAKTVADLWKSGRVSGQEGRRLLRLCCMPSPMFLTGFLCTGMLRLSLPESLPYLAALYLPPVLCFLPGRRRGGSGRQGGDRRQTDGRQGEDSLNAASVDVSSAAGERRDGASAAAPPSSEAGPLQTFLNFEKAMMDGFLIMAKIGGYLMFFTMLSYFFRSWIRNPFLSSLVPGLLEMTSGIAFTVQTGLPGAVTTALCFAFAAFGGLSGLTQTMSVLKSTPFSGRSYVFWKLFQAVLTFAAVWMLCPK